MVSHTTLYFLLLNFFLQSNQRNFNMTDMSCANPVFSIVCHPSYDNVIKRAKQLEDRFDKMVEQFPCQVRALMEAYTKQTVLIESTKIDSVSTAPISKQGKLNEYYNNDRLELISCMEKKLNKLPNPNNDVNWNALQLMKNWYFKNKHFPYPSEKEVKQMSIEGNIPVTTVETWFYFQRLCGIVER